MLNIYLASSWRNHYQESVLKILRKEGFEVYDFKHPRNEQPEYNGFHWSEIDESWSLWTVPQYWKALEHTHAEEGFNDNMAALINCDTVVLLLPSGRSAHLEAGWAKGNGKGLQIYCPEPTTEPELMYKMADGIYWDIDDLIKDLHFLNTDDVVTLHEKSS